MSIAKGSVDASVLEALPEELTWAGRPQEADLASLPGCPAVYLLVAPTDVPVQLATTQHLRRLAISRLVDREGARRGRVDLAEIVRGIRWREVYSAFEGRWWYYRLARRVYPKQYRRLISFGPAWFLEVDWRERVPEVRVTERVWQSAGECVGPWLTHDTCQQALEGLWGLFDLCRYPEQVRRAPGGQRCAYADMGRCDAPCDGAGSLEGYAARCRAAWAFVQGGSRAWVDEARERMKGAAREERFEEAGLIKRQIAWAWKWHDNWAPAIRPVEELNYLLVVPVTRRRAWRVFLFWQGDLVAGPVASDRALPEEAVRWLRDQFVKRPEQGAAQVRTEQTWLVAHFLNSKAGDASLVEPLRKAEAPDGLEDALRERIAARRAAGKRVEGAGGVKSES